MAQVSQPRGKSFEDAKLRFEDVQRALKEKSGTVCWNSLGLNHNGGGGGGDIWRRTQSEKIGHNVDVLRRMSR